MAVQIEASQIQSSAIVTDKLNNGAVTSDKLGSGSVIAAKIGADAVDGSKIADDSIDSEHIADSAILEAALATGAVAFSKLKSADIETTLAGSNSKIPRADAVKSYVDNAVEGRQWKEAVTVATTGNITLSGEQTIDGVLTSSDRVLVWQQTDASENGIYVSASGAWSRASDFDGAGDKIHGSAVLARQGTNYDNVQFVCMNATEPTVGTDDINFTMLQAGVADDSVSTAKIQDGAITNPKLGADAVDGSKIADDSIGSEHVADSAILEAAIANGAVSTAKIADDAITAAKCGFATNWDVLSPDGVATAFDLSATVDDTFAFVLVVRNGIVLKQVAASPSGMDEYTIDLTGGTAGVSELNFGAAPTNGSDLRCMFLS